MRGLGKVMLTLMLTTVVLLLYVHERVEMLRLSYQIDEKSRELSGRSEDFRRLQFEVSQLRSPQSLEKRLEELTLPLTIPKEIKVLRVPVDRPEPVESALTVPLSSNRFFHFLGQWIQVAQARTDE